MRYIKYVVVSIFCIVLFSIFAFADSSDVVATVNGVGYSSISAAVSAAQSGDSVFVVADTSVNSQIDIPSNVSFIVPNAITIDFYDNGRFSSLGNCSLNGTFVGHNPNGSYLFAFRGGNSVVTGSFYSNDGSRTIGLTSSALPDTVVSIYGGYFSAVDSGIFNHSDNGNLIIYGGEFIPTIQGNYTLGGAAIPEINSNGVVVTWGSLYQIGQLVSSAISWLVLFVTAIVSNKLLLIWLLVIFVGLGIGLIKRICRS